MAEIDHDALVAAAWAEHESAHAEYETEKQRLRHAGISKSGVHKKVKGPRWRLVRAWMWLHELGEVPLENNRRGRVADDA